MLHQHIGIPPEVVDALENGRNLNCRERTYFLKLLEKFYEGAFLVAIKTETPILVQTIVGSGKLYPATSAIRFRPGTVQAYWDEPIETKNLTNKDIPMLIEKVRGIMTQHLLENQDRREGFSLSL